MAGVGFRATEATSEKDLLDRFNFLVRELRHIILKRNLDSDQLRDGGIVARTLDLDEIKLDNFTFTDADPNATSVSWANGVLYFNANAYYIANSNTSKKFISWVVGDLAFSSSDTRPAASSTTYEIGTNKSGVFHRGWDKIPAEGVGTEQLENLCVTNAQIASLDAGKITTGYLSADHIDVHTLTVDKLIVKTPHLSNDAWTNNSPSAGKAAWNTHTLEYNGVTYTIAAGNTANKYIYWLNGASSYTTSATFPTLGPTDYMIAINNSGTHDIALGRMAIQGVDTTLLADAAVNNVKVSGLSAAKLNEGILPVARIEESSLTAEKLSIPIPLLVGDTWTNNSPSAGMIAWNAHTLRYKGVAYTISAGDAGDAFTKIDDPAQPPQSAPALRFSDDGVYLAGAHWDYHHITVFKLSGTTLTHLAVPTGALPNGGGASVDFSPDGTYLAVGDYTSPYLIVYKRTGDAFASLSLSSDPAGDGNGVEFSPDGQYLAVAHDTSPYVTIYKRSGDTFTKLSNPGTLPTGNGQDVAWSHDGTYLAVAHLTTPFITIYKRSGDVFTKLSNPATLPPAYCNAAAFSPDSTYLAVGHSTTPFITIYKRSGDVFTKLSNPADLPPAAGRSVAFSPVLDYLAVTHNTSPYVTIYKRSGDTFTKLSNPATLPLGISYSAAFAPEAAYLAVGHDTSPYLTIYACLGDMYIYWVNGATSYTASQTSPTLGPEDYLIATNTSGTYDKALGRVAKSSVDISSVPDGSIDSIKISGLDATKLNAGYIPAARIDGGTVDGSKLNIALPLVDDDVWTNNSPSAGKIAWGAHTLRWRGTAYTIAAGNSNSNKWIYWVNGDSAYTTSATAPALTTTSFVVAVNNGGTCDIALHRLATKGIDVTHLAATVAASIQGTPACTVGSLVVRTINVSCQAKDAAGVNLAAVHALKVWLSDAAKGGECAVAPSGAVAIGTSGTILKEITAKVHFIVLTSATGAYDLNITEAGAKTLYVNVEYQGTVNVSSAVVFPAP